MKQLLLWLIGVALGVVVLLAAVLGVSYSFTSEGAKPASEVQFAGYHQARCADRFKAPLII